MSDRYRRELVRYYNYLADRADARRWDYFSWKHELSEFVPFGPLDTESFSLRADMEEELAVDMHPSQDPLTYEDCCNYFAGRPLTCGAGYHQSSVLYRRG